MLVKMRSSSDKLPKVVLAGGTGASVAKARTAVLATWDLTECFPASKAMLTRFRSCSGR